MAKKSPGPNDALDSHAATGNSDGAALLHRKVAFRDDIIEQLQIPDHPEITVYVTYRKDAPRPMPVFLNWLTAREQHIGRMLDEGFSADASISIEEDLPALPEFPSALLERGCALVTFAPDFPPKDQWPEGRPMWIWPTPDAAGVEFFLNGCAQAPGQFGLVIDYIETRGDLDAERIGFMGGSATAMLGYGLISKEPRITCAVLGAGSGYLSSFAEGWARNYDWEEKGFSLWPETVEKLRTEDPILFVDRVYPTAVLMLNGGHDRIIPIDSAIEYYEALHPYYAEDPERVRMVIFQGAGHGWDQKWHHFMVMDWFERYLLHGDGK